MAAAKSILKFTLKLLSVKRLFLVILALLLFATSYATHNRAGQITYRHKGGNVYEITVITYTRESVDADRPVLPIDWGDGSPLDSLYRTGIISMPNDVQYNFYQKEHTYPGAGSYNICVNDANRNQGVVNIANSVQVVFGIQTTLQISSLFAANNSVRFDRIPIQDACLFQPWIHNPGAYDTDNDSLSYELVYCLGEFCSPLGDNIYRFPDEVSPGPANQLDIDPVTGTITWDSPQISGEYNIAIAVHEWRQGKLISTVIRDMQITVNTCDNIIPEIANLPDTCIEAGQSLNFELQGSDPNDSQVKFSGYAGAFAVTNSPATLSDTNSMPEPATVTFNWNTLCEHVRVTPYQTVFEITDNNVNPLSNVMEMNILVVAPAPENLTAEAVGSAISLNWQASPCSNAIGYKVYRRIDPSGFVPSHCETGVPEYTGYSEIATLEGIDNTSYLDEDEIIFGRETCYMVIAYFADGAESYASNEACAKILFEIPIIIQNSVGLTGANGRDSVTWRNPILLDPAVFPPPYSYKLYRSEGFGSANQLVFETGEETDINQLDTTFISEPLNTQATAHTYRVDLYSNGALAASSNKASSIFLVPDPNDNQIRLDWQVEVPWINFRYEIYRQNTSGDFELLATTPEQTYTDSGLVNNREYCYYVISYGSYFAIEENDTLVNFSQRICSQPYDRTPPCAPVVTAEGDCVNFTVDLSWSDPNQDCEETDDVTAFNLYFKPTEAGEYELLQTFSAGELREYLLQTENSIAGCYAITALDSLAPWPDGEFHQNESPYSAEICFDNCPEYELPNVFSPNGDGKNDVFKPFRNRSVESVQFVVYNRWGTPVFETSDPEVNWDGYDSTSGKLVSDGTYYYTCVANSIRLSGIVPVNLSGYITVFSGRSNTGE